MFRIVRQYLVPCLLASAVLLPPAAHAADSDGDGVDDSIDAFPNHAEATTDTDHDGKPDVLNNLLFSDSFDGIAVSGWTGIVSNSPIPLTGGWALNSAQTHSGSGSLGAWASSGGGAKRLYVTLTIPAQGATVSYWHLKNLGCSGMPCNFVNGATLSSQLFTSASWVKNTYSLDAGSQQLNWYTNCGGAFPDLCGYLDDVEVRADSMLVEDTDDDNDDIPDAFDPAPLDANSVSPLDGNYKGSSVKDGVQGPRGK